MFCMKLLYRWSFIVALFCSMAFQAAHAAAGDPAPVGGSFVLTPKVSQWIVVRGQKAEATVVVRDIDGQFAYRAEKVPLNTPSTVLSLPALAPGFYRLVVQVPSEAAVKPVPFVVLPEARPALDKRFGIDAALSWYGGDYPSVDRAIELMKAAGIGSVRDRFRWAQVQLAPGAPIWGRFQNVAKKVAAAGIGQVTSFHDSPAWARYSTDTTTSGDRKPPRDLAALQALGAAFARDMGPYFDGVEYWNEQNTDFYLGSPWQYASELKAFYTGVKSVRPQLKVVIGASSGAPGEFFKGTYESGGAAAFDVRNKHYYADPDKMLEFLETSVAPVELAGGVAGQPGWITETGKGAQSTTGPITAESERLQAEYLVKTYSAGLASGYERVFFFFFRELIEPGRGNWGVLNADFSPRPSYAALAALIRHVGGRPLTGYRRGTNSMSVFFGDASTGIVAVAWGTEAAAAKWGSDAKFSDMFGRPLARESLTAGAEPVLVAGGAGSLTGVTRPKALAASVAARTTLRVTGDVIPPGSVGKEVVGAHALEAPVIVGSTVRMGGAVLATGAATAQALNVECTGGEGLTPVQKTVPVSVGPNSSTAYACDFKVGATKGVRGLMRASVTTGGVTDAAVVRTVSVADTSPTALAAKVLPPLCVPWRVRAAPIVTMTLEPKTSATSTCPDGFIVRATLNTPGDGWVFPIADVPVALAGMDGIEFKAQPLSGVPYPLKTLMMQLVDKDGAIWVLPLVTQKLPDGRQHHTALFPTAKLAAWSTVKKSALVAGTVAQISIGYAGGGGSAGDKTAFVISELRSLN
jgi:hypothetical protein